MNVNSRNLTKAGVLACSIAALSAPNVFADADIAVQPSGTALEATTNVDLCVVVPRVLIFGVGDVADDVAKLRWTIDNAAGVAVGNNQSYSGTPGTFTPPAPFNTAAVAEVVSGGGAGSGATANVAELPVFLFSNSGADVEITTTVSGGATGGGTVDALDHDTVAATTIPIASFTAGDGGVIAQPALANNQVATTAHTAGIVNLADTWTYEYTPATIPTAGTYEARVTYVAATP